MAETETVVSTSASEQPASGGGSYVQSLLDPAIDGAEPSSEPQAGAPAASEPETAPVAESGAPETPPAGETAATAPDVDALIQQYATETGLDPNDPNQRKTLKRMADKELHIRKLTADLKKYGAPDGTTAPVAEPPALLTEYERKATEAPNGTGAATAPPPQPAQPAVAATPPDGQPASTEPTKYNDIGDEWKTIEDSLRAESDAWTANELNKVHEIHVARERRNFDTYIAPKLLAYVAKYVQGEIARFRDQELADVLPSLKQSVVDRQMAESRDFAVDQLRAAGASDIDKMFEPTEGLPKLVYEGQEFPNTPMNRLFLKHPEIMAIEVKDKDRDAALRKTLIARYRIAYQIEKGQAPPGVPAATAKKLVEAGAEMRERQNADRARQSLNAGSGATGLMEKPNKSYVQQLNSLPGEVSFGSLIS